MFLDTFVSPHLFEDLRLRLLKITITSLEIKFLQDEKFCHFPTLLWFPSLKSEIYPLLLASTALAAPNHHKLWVFKSQEAYNLLEDKCYQNLSVSNDYPLVGPHKIRIWVIRFDLWRKMMLFVGNQNQEILPCRLFLSMISFWSWFMISRSGFLCRWNLYIFAGVRF